MGFFESMTAQTYRYTLDGRRVYTTFVGVRPAQYLVPDAHLAMMIRRFRWYYISALVTVVIGTRLVLDAGGWPWLVVGILALAELGRLWLTQGLTRVKIARQEFAPVDRKAGAVAVAQATGAPVLWTLLVLTSLLAVGVIWSALAERDWWLLAASVPLYSVMAATFAWQLRLIRSSRQD